MAHRPPAAAPFHVEFDARRERLWLHGILATVGDAVVCSDQAGTIELFNPAAERIFGWPAAEILGRNVSVLMPGPHARRHDGYMRRYVNGGAPRVIGIGRETVGRRRDGSEFPMSLTMTEGTADGRRIFTAVIRDVSEQRRVRDELERHRAELEALVRERTRALEAANRQLEMQAMQDALTGVANRRRFDEVLDAEIRRAARSSSPLSLLMCDVDYFKAFNDHHGHVEGDRCLRRVAQLLATHGRRAGDLTARYGGEEFAVLLPDTPGDVALVMAEARREAVWREGIENQGAPGARVTLSIGVACLAHGAPLSDGARLLGRADRALYRAKRDGRNVVVAYEGDGDGQ